MARSDEEQAELDAEVRRRYDPDALVRRAGDVGAAMVAVVDAAASLTDDQRRTLHEAYEATVPEMLAAGLHDQWERAFTYQRPFPEHPGDLYAIDPWCRAAFDYAVLVADPVALGPDAIRPDGPTTVGRCAAGMVMALSVDLAAREGWYHPVSAELASWLRRPWEKAMGAGSPVSSSSGPATSGPARPGGGR